MALTAYFFLASLCTLPARLFLACLLHRQFATVPKPLQPRMASKRLAASTVNWAEFASKIPEAQRASFNALKNKTDGYVRKIGSLPDKMQDIDWNAYKARIQVAGE